MDDDRSEIAPELLVSIKSLLLVLDPLIEAVSSFVSTADAEPGKCQQVWCPVCALAAVTSGEQHPLVAILAEHGAALLAVVRAMTDSPDAAPPGSGEPPDRPTAPASRYQPIPVIVHD